MSLLNEISDRQSGPRVLSEQHDAGRINWVAGLSDPGEMLGCGRYQQLRRLDGEADAEYAERLNRLLPTLPAADRQKIETAMKSAALKRAGLDTSGGRVAVMVAGKEPAWHKLGVHVEAATTSEHAIRLAGLAWGVTKLPMGYTWGEKFVESSDTFAVVRDDTGAHLGTVGSRYKPIQNAEAFEFMDTVLKEFGARYETAGSVYGGAKVWMQAVLPGAAFEVTPGDAVEGYALFVNPHDGSGVAQCFPTSNRVVCANTLRVATGAAVEAKSLRIRHTGSVKDKLNDARRALGLAVRGFEQFRGHAEVLYRTRVADHNGYFNEVLDSVLEITQAKVRMGAERLADADCLALAITSTEARETLVKKYDRAINQRTGILDDILNRYEEQRSGKGGARGTGWGVLNAVTEHADHFAGSGPRRGTQHERDSRLFESILSGERDQMKQTALGHALALAG